MSEQHETPAANLTIGAWEGHAPSPDGWRFAGWETPLCRQCSGARAGGREQGCPAMCCVSCMHRASAGCAKHRLR